jgi:hypothetical protein
LQMEAPMAQDPNCFQEESASCEELVGSAAAPVHFSAMIISIKQALGWLGRLLFVLPTSCLRLIDLMVSGDSKRNGKVDSSDDEN